MLFPCFFSAGVPALRELEESCLTLRHAALMAVSSAIFQFARAKYSFLKISPSGSFGSLEL